MHRFQTAAHSKKPETAVSFRQIVDGSSPARPCFHNSTAAVSTSPTSVIPCWSIASAKAITSEM